MEERLRRGTLSSSEKYEERRKVWRERYAEKHRGTGKFADKNLRKQYGITLAQKEEMAESQDYKCAACEVEVSELRQLCVDHDRCANRIRGLLCNRCNVALGCVGDDVEKLQGLLRYLRRHCSYVLDWPPTIVGVPYVPKDKGAKTGLPGSDKRKVDVNANLFE